MKNELQKLYFQQLRDKRQIKNLEYQLANSRKTEDSALSKANYIIAIITSVLIALFTGFTLNSLNKQNRLVFLQSQLIESERRGDLVILFSSLQNQISQEIEYSQNNLISDNSKSSLISLLHSLKPYHVYHSNQNTSEDLKTKYISPERGLILQYLAISEINEKDKFEIYEKGNFTYSDLSGLNLSDKNFKNLDLSFANLTGTNFKNKRSEGLNLNSCEAHETNFCGVTFSNTTLNGTFRESLFTNSTAVKLNLSNSIYITCDFTDSDFDEVQMCESSFISCDLRNVYLQTASIGCNIFKKQKTSLLAIENKGYALYDMRSSYYKHNQESYFEKTRFSNNSRFLKSKFMNNNQIIKTTDEFAIVSNKRVRKISANHAVNRQFDFCRISSTPTVK